MEHFKKLEKKIIPDGLDYYQINGLRKEAMQKLDKFNPRSIGQASRISGCHQRIYRCFWCILRVIEEAGKDRKDCGSA